MHGEGVPGITVTVFCVVRKRWDMPSVVKSRPHRLCLADPGASEPKGALGCCL